MTRHGTTAGERTTPPPDRADLPSLPVLPEPTSPVAGIAMVALPVASGAGALVMALGRPGSPLAVGSLVVLVASVLVGGLLLAGQRHSTRSRLHRHRRRYLGIVDDIDRRLELDAGDMRRQAEMTRPTRWGDGHPGTLRVRLGTATAARPVPVPQRSSDELAEVDPVCAAAVTDLHERRGLAHGLPLDLPLDAAPHFSVGGAGELAVGVLRGMVLDLVRAVPPHRLAIVVRGGADHPWVRWLPHCSSAIVAGRSEALDGDLVDPVPDPLPRLLAVPGLAAVVVVDFRPPDRRGAVDPATGMSGRDPRAHHWSRHDLAAGVATGIPVDGAVADAGTTRIDVEPGVRLTVRTAGGAITGQGTVVSAAQARMIARDLAGRPRRTPRPGAPGPSGDQGSGRWPAGRANLRAVVGHRPDGAPVVLDLKDAAQDGMGPHGLIVGATGAGKSELLRTLTLRLVQGHSPDELALLLVDYKGGSTFAAFAPLPHVAGMLTNLSGDDGLVGRFADALRGESTRRQAVLAAAEVADIAAYRRLPAPPEPLPTLLVVVDEYAELLAAHPDLAELFVKLGRIGRSLGLHLLLATQRLDAGRSRGVEGHLSYRVVLRTFTAAESQELLGSTAAFTLPRTPGEALLGRAGQDPVRFRVDPSQVAAEPERAPTPGVDGPRPFPVSTAVLDRWERLTRLHHDPRPPTTTPAVADPLAAAVRTVVERSAGAPDGRPARPVWLPPLPTRLPLDDLPATVVSGPVVVVPFGLLDRPTEQRQTTLTWTPLEQPNLLVTGTGRTGRTTTLLTVVAATGWAATPGSVTVYGVALGGPTLTSAAGWPHVAGVAAPDDPDFARRLLGLVVDEIDRREKAAAGTHPGPVDSPAGPQAGRPWPLVLLVVDDWAPSSTLDEEIDRLVADVARRGPAVGVASAVATAAGVVLRGRVAGSFGLRVELRAADAFDSAIDRTRAAALPAGVPGRALVVDGYAQVALPPDPAAHPSGPRPSDSGSRLPGQDNPGGPRPGPQVSDPEPASPARPNPGGPNPGSTTPGEPDLGGPNPGGSSPGGPDPGSTNQGSTDPDGPGVDIHRRWLGHRVPRHHPLPAQVSLSSLWPGVRTPAVAAEPAGPAVLVGVEEADGPAVRHVFDRSNPHLLVLGDPGSGRTGLLRSLARQVGAARPEWGAAHPGPLVAAIDLRGHLVMPDEDASLPDAGTDSPVPASDPALPPITWAASVTRADQVASLVGGLLRHVGLDPTPGAATTGAPAPAGSTGAGRPAVFLLVDDEEQLAGGGVHPLAPLLPALRCGADLGLHLVVARSSGGYARARYEPLHQLLADLGTPTLLLSASAEEGRLNHRLSPRRLPPGRAQWAVRGRAHRLVQTPRDR